MTARPLFPTSVIGSLPRPRFVRDLLADGDPGAEPRRRLLGSAIAAAVALQEAAGLDVVSDGEWWRRSYLGVIAELAHGFALSTNPADGRPWTVVVDRLAPRRPGFVAEEIRFLRTLTGKPVKATLPAPALLGERLWDPVASAKAYPTREAFVRDCVPILRREAELIRDAGASILQIDDPHLCLFAVPEVRRAYADPDRAADFAVDMDNAVVAGIDGLTLAVHLCRRAGARARGEADHRGGYEPILGQLGRLAVRHVTMEFTAPGAGDMAVFRRLPEHVEVGLGCISCQPGEIDPVDTIVARVERALEHLPPERIVLNPDCGFAPGSAAEVSLDEVYQKLLHLVAAAARLRKRFA